MEFRLLGPLEVRRDGTAVALGGAKQQALLAILLVHANEVVSRDTLLEELWPGRVDARHSLEIQVSRLRKLLEGDVLLVTWARGYSLEVEPGQIDAHRFERLLESGRRANSVGDTEGALASLEQALSLWRGAALAELAVDGLLRIEAERLDELRSTALEEQIEARLTVGQHRELVPELRSLLSKQPRRERLAAQLMLALYRSGRQEEALAVYAETRRRLVEDLGLEPGPALRELEQAILWHDDSLRHVRGSRLLRGRRRLLVAGAVAMLAAAAGAAGVLLASGGTKSSEARALGAPGSLALFALESGRLLREIPVQSPLRSSFGAGALWTISSAGTLTKTDPASGEVLASLNSGAAVPCGLAVGEGAVWVSDCTSPALARIDPAHGVVERIALPRFNGPTESSPHEVALGAGSVWVGQGDLNPSWVVRLDPRTGSVQHTIRIDEVGANALAFGDGALWVVSGYKGYLTKIDPRTNRIATTIRSLPGNMCCVAVGGGFVWAATVPDRKVWKLSQDGTVLASIALPAAPESLTYGQGALWVADGEAGTVVRVDPTSTVKRTYALGHRLLGVAVEAGVVAVGVQQNEEDVTAGLTGKVVRIGLGSNQLDWSSTDPAATQTAFNPWQVQFQYATCAKLLSYRDSSGPAGRRLIPEVAAAMPTVGDGGRTYTFTIRRGYRFSPPSNEPVGAQSFRHAIERFLSSTLQPGPWHLALLADVVGASAYHAGKSDHVSGIAVRGNTLTIRLTSPAPDLPARLALPSFCAVPVGLATAYQGLHDPIPSAGPYYLAARTREVVVLKRNPNYHGPRPRGPDAFVYRMDMGISDAVARLRAGKLDVILEDDPALAPTTAVARSAGPLYRRVANNWISLLALNTQQPLFANRRVRRAVAYAIDRSALAGPVSLPTGHLLTPNFPGFDRWPAYPSKPSLLVARRLLGYRHLRATLATYDSTGDPRSAALVRAVRQRLAGAGIAVTVLPLSGEDDEPTLAAKLARADIAAITRDASQTIDPVTYLKGLPYLPAPDRARLDQLDSLRSPRRELGAAAVAHTLERDAVYIPYADEAIPELVSDRLGCVIHQPEYPGIDLAALCVSTSRR